MRTTSLLLSSALSLLLFASACGDKDDTGTDGGSSDGGSTDGGSSDGGSSDGGSTDGGSTDGGSSDGGSTDGGSTDGGSTDGGSTDGGSTDGGSTDGGSSDGGSSDGGSSDGGSSDGGSSDGGSTEDATAIVVLSEYPAGSPISGAAITLGTEEYTTDAKGSATLAVPTWSAYQYTASAAGFLNMTSFGYNDGEGFTAGQLMVRPSTAAAVYSAAGLSYDSTLGTAVVVVFDVTSGSAEFLAGATVDLGADAELVMAADASSGLGFSAGSTTLEDSSAWILFLNHDPGAATSSVTPPDGYSCTVFPGEEPSVSFELEANTLNIITFACVAE